MRKILFLFAILFGINLDAQVPYFNISPFQGFCINSINNNPTVTVTNPSSTTATYSWVVGNPFCLPGTAIITAPNGSTAVVYFGTNDFCCTQNGALWQIYCSAYDNLNNLQATYSMTYNVHCAPSLSIASASSNSVNSIICLGSSATLTATGAPTYSWSGPGVQNFTNTNVSVSPTTTSCYSVTGTNTFGCHSTSSLCLSVQPLPAITIAGNATVCLGSAASFSCSGANTYTWSTGSTSAVVSVTPVSNSIYSVIGTDTNGCINSQSVQVKLSSCVGLENDFQLDDVIRIYPNPANDFLKVENNTMEGDSSIGVRIINNLGQVILIQEITFREKSAQLNISELDAGVYSLQLVTKNYIPIIKRFVKK